MSEKILGIDVGGSAIKGAPVDVRTGRFLQPRIRIPIPDFAVPAKPKQVAAIIAEISREFAWSGPIGVGFPAAIRNGVVLTAANIHKSWIGANAATIISKATRRPTVVLNDADAAALAEMEFGAGRKHRGVVLVVTVGTGLGTAIFTNRQLLPNTELGHIEMDGKEAEHRSSDGVRKKRNLTWKKWAKLLNEYLCTMEHLLWPDLIIIGGGVSQKHAKFFPHLKVHAKVVPAQLRNRAGIIGAALACGPRRP